MKLDKYCRQKGYEWTHELDRQHKFLLRSAQIKNYNQEEIDGIIIDLLRKNKQVIGRRKSERLKLAMQSVEMIMKRQVGRKK